MTTIPLLTLKDKSNSLPISLTYSGNGVKLSDLPTWTGMNWRLNAGGIINRVVPDLPDETLANRRYLLNEDVLASLTDSQSNFYLILQQNNANVCAFSKRIIKTSIFFCEAVLCLI